MERRKNKSENWQPARGQGQGRLPIGPPACRRASCKLPAATRGVVNTLVTVCPSHQINRIGQHYLFPFSHILFKQIKQYRGEDAGRERRSVGEECLDRRVPAPSAPGKGPGPSGWPVGQAGEILERGFSCGCERPWDALDGAHNENDSSSEWSREQGRLRGLTAVGQLFGQWWSPGHLCLDKSFSASILACLASCSRRPWAPFTLRARPVFPASILLPPRSPAHFHQKPHGSPTPDADSLSFRASEPGAKAS